MSTEPDPDPDEGYTFAIFLFNQLKDNTHALEQALIRREGTDLRNKVADILANMKRVLAHATTWTEERGANEADADDAAANG